MPRTGNLFLAVVLCALAGCASHSVSVWGENDSITLGPTSETNYSSGLQITFAPIEAHQRCEGDCDGQYFRRFVDFLNILEPGTADQPYSDDTWLRYGIGQKFFTPDDLQISHLQLDERPYAGWLFTSLDISNETFDAPHGTHYRNTVGLHLGMVGPASLGEDMQRYWHKRCGCTAPQGWQHQLGNEPGFIYTLGHENRLLRKRLWQEFSYDFVGSTSASIGNIYTAMEVGGTVRFGWNLNRGWGAKTIGDVGFSDVTRTDAAPGFFVFGGITGRYVAQDIFLDGNTWRDSHSVERIPHVYDQTIGFGVNWGQLDVKVSFVRRSEQYTTQATPDRFGSIIVTWNPQPRSVYQ